MRRWAVSVLAVMGVLSLAALLIASLPAAPPATGPEYGPVGWGAPAASSEPVEVSAVQAATVGGPSLVVATFNVCKVDCAAPAPAWDVRRDRVARVVGEANVDVLGVQEATNNPTSRAKTQLEDLAATLAPLGLSLVSYPNEANECRRPRDASGQLAGPSPCDNTSALFYRAATVEQVSLPGGRPSAGVLLASSIAPGIEPGSAIRSVMWAYLSPRGANQPFLAVSMHTDNAKTTEAEAARVAIGGVLDDWAAAWNAQHGMSGVPVILTADLNSYRKRQPAGVQQVLVDQGWTDAASAPTRRNVQYSTINYNPMLGLTEQGFPSKPYEFRTSKKNPVLDATRIDYVMALGAGVTPLDYEVVIHLNPDGSFNPDYQASDHQMVRATLALPAR